MHHLMPCSIFIRRLGNKQYSIYENLTSPHASAFSAKCLDAFGCPKWFRSHLALDLSSGILVPQEKTTVKLPFNKRFSCRKINRCNHPDHTLITYPNLGSVDKSVIFDTVQRQETKLTLSVKPAFRNNIQQLIYDGGTVIAQGTEEDMFSLKKDLRN